MIRGKRRSVCREADALYWWRSSLPVSRVKQTQAWSVLIWMKSASGGPPFAPAEQASSMVPKDSGKRGLTFGNEASLSLDLGKFDYFRVAPAAGLP